VYRRQDVRADGTHGHHCPRYRLHPFADLRARHAGHRPRAGDRKFAVRADKRCYEPVLRGALRDPPFVIWSALAFFLFSLFLFTRLGQEFIPTLDEEDLAMHAMRIPSTALSQSTSMQLQVERALRALPEVAFVFSKTGTADIASDPMPPHVSDTFIILKPKADWPDPGVSKDEIARKKPPPRASFFCRA
jgi:Cu/Ag efflux pump CusA